MAGHVILDTAGMFHERLFDHFDKECKTARDERKIHSRHAAEAQPRNLRSKQLRGDQRVERLRAYLENGFVDPQGKRIVRSREQRQLHEVYIRTCLPKLYEGEWEDNQERILAQYGITKLQQESLVVMPRRSGKTWSMAMFCAAMLIVCSDIEISVFATGQRTASKLLKLMTKMMTSLLAYVGDDQFKIVQQNKEAVILLGPDKTERTCGCYPGSVTVRFCCCLFVGKNSCARIEEGTYVLIFLLFPGGQRYDHLHSHVLKVDGGVFGKANAFKALGNRKVDAFDDHVHAFLQGDASVVDSFLLSSHATHVHEHVHVLSWRHWDVGKGDGQAVDQQEPGKDRFVDRQVHQFRSPIAS